MPTVSCPSCSRALEVDPSYRDWTVRCPHCATEFVPGEASPAAFEADEQRRYDDRNYPDDDRPRRRRRRRDDRQEAKEVVYSPGLWLELCGWVGALVLMGGAMFWLLVSAGAKNNPNANDDEVMGITLALISGLSAIPYAVVMVVGGRKMRAMSGYGWALIASIGGISSVVLFPFACVFAFVPVVFGVWGLVALANPVVSLAFDENARGSTDWED